MLPPLRWRAFLYDEVEGGGLLIWGDDGPFVPLTPKQGKEYCEKHKHPWQQVSPILRQMRANDILKRITDANLTMTDEGLLINESVLEGLREVGWLPLSPVHKTGFREGRLLDSYTTVRPCDSWWCRGCGVERSQRLLRVLEAKLQSHDIVYTVECPYDRNLAGRFGHRARDHKAEYFWFRRCDDRVFFVATESLPGRTVPTALEARSPDAALSWLRTEAMVVPGYNGHGFSKGWDPSGNQPDDEGEDEDRPKWAMWVVGLDREKAARARELAIVQAKETLGLDVRTGHYPPEHESQILEILKSCIDEVRER